jgi:hypothetical protein
MGIRQITTGSTQKISRVSIGGILWVLTPILLRRFGLLFFLIKFLFGLVHVRDFNNVELVGGQTIYRQGENAIICSEVTRLVEGWSTLQR